MLRGLLEKALRESWLLIALSCTALGVTMGLFVQILPQFQEGLTDLIVQVPFIRTLLSGLMGMDVSEGLTPQMLLVVVWSHPIVLAIVLGFEIAFCTRFPAGEIEQFVVEQIKCIGRGPGAGAAVERVRARRGPGRLPDLYLGGLVQAAAA